MALENLLRETRTLRRDQSTARDSWFAALPWESKEAALFELEMLLKGLACFGNPRNHPGPPRGASAVGHDYRDELHIAREALARCIELIRQLLGDRDKAFTFARYLETVLPEDAERTKLLKDQLTQDTPEEALFVLRNSFSAFIEMADGLLRLGRVSHRQYHAFLGTVVKEVARNVYFNPLVTLEFRPEFDRIRHPRVLEALQQVQNDAAHRVVALALLTLFRGLRYVTLVDGYAKRPQTTRRAYVILAVLRSDLRALTRFLSRGGADVMAEGFERELLTAGASAMHERYEELSHEAGALTALRATLENVASTLRVEVRRPFERDLPTPDSEVATDDLGPQLVVVSAAIRASLQHSVQVLCAEIQPDVDLPELASDEQARRAASERLRRDVWMFTQILRAFLAKAAARPEEPDRWESLTSFRFVKEFLQHFRTMGYQLVRMSDYERLDTFLLALESLRDVDVLEPVKLKEAIRECDSFYRYLESLFEKISHRAELRDVPFDRKHAAETLKIYLSAA